MRRDEKSKRVEEWDIVENTVEQNKSFDFIFYINGKVCKKKKMFTDILINERVTDITATVTKI